MLFRTPGRVFQHAELRVRDKQAMPHLFLFLTIVAYLQPRLLSGYLRTGREISGRLGTVFLALGLVAHYFALLERSRGTAHRPVPRYFRLDVAFRLASRAHLSRPRTLSPPTLRRRVRDSFRFRIFSRRQSLRRRQIFSPPAPGPVFAFHVTLSILAYAAFGLSFVLASSSSSRTACCEIVMSPTSSGASRPWKFSNA